jgi:replication factor C subunit 1
MHIHKTYKPAFTKENPGAKMALLSGPPGIGKSTVASLVAQQLGYEVLELNASDARNKGSVQEEIGAVVSCRSLNMSGKVTKRVIIMDEVDGMGGSDRGGIAELIKIAKTSKTPIICICNDRQNPKIRSLCNHCYDLRVKRPTKQQIAARIMQVAAKEGLNVESNAAELLVEQAGNDIRQVINALQMWRAKSSSMSYLDVKGSTDRIEKDKILRSSPFDACGQILGGREPFDDRFNSFFIDYSLVPLLVQQNYIDSSRNGIFKAPGLSDDERMYRLSAAADAVSDMDLIGSMIMGADQHWELLPSQAAVCIHAGHLVQGFQPFPAFPQWLGKYSSTNKSRRLVQELVTHTALDIAQGFTSMRLEYVPYLRSHMLQPLLKKGSDGAEEVVKIMDTYGLSKDDFMETMKDLQFVVERDPNFTDQFSNLDAKVKASLTRLYNATSHRSQALVDEQAGLKSSGRGGGRGAPLSLGAGGGDDGLVAEDEDAVEALVGEGGGADDGADDGDNIDISAFMKKGRGGGAKRGAVSAEGKPAATKKAKK